MSKRPIQSNNAMVQELQFLRRDIDACHSLNNAGREVLSLQAQTPQLERQSKATDRGVSVSTRLTFVPTNSNLRTNGITMSSPSWVCARILQDTKSPRVLKYSFSAQKRIPPASMRVTAAARFRAADTHVTCASVTFSLPMALACRMQSNQPSQDAAFKLTLDTDAKAAGGGAINIFRRALS